MRVVILLFLYETDPWQERGEVEGVGGQDSGDLNY